MNHQKLHCYLRLVRLVEALQRHMPQWPRGYGALADQLRRASISGVLNLVEGNGRESPRDRRRFFVTSTSSLAEVDACLDLVKVFAIAQSGEVEAWQAELRQVYAMIRGLR